MLNIYPITSLADYSACHLKDLLTKLDLCLCLVSNHSFKKESTIKHILYFTVKGIFAIFH